MKSVFTRRSAALVALSLLAAQVSRAQVDPSAPTPTTYVLDRADALPEDDERALSARLAALDDSTSVQVVVFTTDLQGASAADVALWASNTAGLGRAGVNNGALILVAPAERETYVSVGTGLEWQVPDSAAAAVVARMLPYFRRGEVSAGLHVGVGRLADLAGSVPWSVRYESAADALVGGEDALGQITRVRGTSEGGALQAEAGPVRLAFPPHWGGVCAPFQEGDPLDLFGRVVGTEPLSIQVLGVDSEESVCGPVPSRHR